MALRPRNFKRNYYFRTILSDHIQILFELRYWRSLFTFILEIYENLLLSEFITQVVSTPSKDLSLAWHALYIIFMVVMFQPFSTVLFSRMFPFQEGLYYIHCFSLVSTYSTIWAFWKNRFVFHNRKRLSNLLSRYGVETLGDSS